MADELAWASVREGSGIMRLKEQDLERLYYFLTLTRRLEDRIRNLYRQGKVVGGCYLSLGQEAVSVGSAYALRDGDVIAPTHREMGALLVRGITPAMAVAQYLGRETGPTRGRDGNMHMGDKDLGIIAFVSPLPDGLPVACGAALSFKMRGEDRVALAYFGDGASSRGDAHESMNFAGIHRLPVIFICNNNQFAYSTPVNNQFAIENLADRAKGYGFEGLVVDGNDVIAVHKATWEAAEKARKGGGPTLIECKTFRRRGHAEHDNAEYVPEELRKEWEKKDPIDKYIAYLKKKGLYEKLDLEAVDRRVEAEIDEAVEFAEKSPLPRGEEVTKGVYYEGEDE